MPIRRGLIALMVVGSTLSWAARGDACSCIGPMPTCQSVWMHDAVFVGRVLRVSGVDNASHAFLSSRRVTMEVLETFRGQPLLSSSSSTSTSSSPSSPSSSSSPSSTIDVFTGSGGGDCGIAFETGQAYVVFATMDKGLPSVLRTGLCDGTRAIERAAEDLSYLRALGNDPPRGGRVFGRVELFDPTVSSSPEFKPSSPKRMAGIPIVLVGASGGDTRTTTTSATGEYEFRDVPPGKYRIDAELPEIYYYVSAPRLFAGEIRDARGCSEVHLRVAHDGRVSGRLVDARGAPIPGLSLGLISASEIDRRAAYPTFGTVTKPDGSYQVTRLPPGRYIAAINPERDFTSSRLLQPRVLHPGVERTSDATIVEVGPGERVTLAEWRMPPTPALVILRGTVTTADGRPAEGAKVYLSIGDDPPRVIGSPAMTDANGQFGIAAIDGQRYRLHASHETTTRDGMPAVEGSGDKTYESASSEPVVAVSNAPPIPLKLLARPRGR